MNIANVLVVEDESVIALDIQNRLRRFGYHVAGSATTGEDAIRLADEVGPDLVLMDIRLKGKMDGIEAAARIRARRDVPIVYLTAYADDDTIQRAKVTAPAGYIIKPLEDRELVTTIEIALHKHVLEQKLKQQTRQLNQVLRTVPEGMVLLDSDLRIDLANPTAVAYLYALSEVRPGERLTHLGAVPIEQVLETHTSGLWQEITVDGPARRVFEVVATPVADHEGALSSCAVSEGWVLVIRDVTREQIIRQYTQQQERLAAIGQLAAGIAHDFNNIMASIILNLYVAQRRAEVLPEAVRDPLQVVSRQAERASDLIRQILDFARSSSIEMRPLDLVPLAREITRMLERTLPENIQVRLEYGKKQFVVAGDSTQLTQVLVNLALNARDAMPTGGNLTISLSSAPASALPESLGQEQTAQSWVCLTVADNGTGIAPEMMPHIFEPFFTTKAPGRGTGLGLSQVYGIVQRHGGLIDIQSEKGTGTTARIYLPVSDTPAAIHRAPEQPVANSNPGKSGCVLVVEDDQPARMAMCEVLELQRYSVIEAANGREALAALEQPDLHVDLVISDLKMPEMGGVELCHELKRRGSEVAMLVVTGYSSQEAISELETLGVKNLLQKPVDPGHLVATVARLLEE